LSGGLDSAILLHYLLEQGRHVQPFYIESGLYWQKEELRELCGYLSEVAHPRMEPMVVLQLPLADIYQGHWSITGQNVPGCDSADEDVFLPGRNVLLATKAAFWCQLHGISELALAILGTNPFPDATPTFFDQLDSVLSTALGSRLRILRPFATFQKREVMELGRDLPLHMTFSCIAPVRSHHCGQCNKCIERQDAFRRVGRVDFTSYDCPSLQTTGTRLAVKV
jgi:7-cyano-7-deazaguanine synthase